MNSVSAIQPLRQIDADDIIIFAENRFHPHDYSRYLDQFRQYQAEGVIRSQFDDDVWFAFSGIKWFEISFVFDHDLYMSHAYNKILFDINKIKRSLKLYVIFNFGSFIISTLSARANVITSFLTGYGNIDYSVESTELIAIQDFLVFIGIDDRGIRDVCSLIRAKKGKRAGQRKLAPLINYLAIDHEIGNMYRPGNLSDDEFIHWFPILFWTKVTFLVPLRATEMLVTPYGCIRRSGSNVFLTLRRTLLKGGERAVCYDVDRDYGVYDYCIPDIPIVEAIEKYTELTASHPRKYLFDYSSIFTNSIFSLASFNRLLATFVEEHLIGNHDYDFARFCSGIKEFEIVSAGDSRPIAMANLFYQNVGADICRQLAGHVNLNTSAHYYTNVSQTVLASSIMEYQRKINAGRELLNDYERGYIKQLSVLGEPCVSPLNPKKTGNISDCIRFDHLHECFGCPFYYPPQQELEKELTLRRSVLDHDCKDVAVVLAEITPNPVDLEEIMLHAHTDITRYREACDTQTKEKAEKWQRRRNTMISY